MYMLNVARDFIAQHYLVGGDWGAENELHSHHYKLELRLSGRQLDRHGFLVDIVNVEQVLESTVQEYRDQILNELPAFVGLNPSIEHLARIICLQLSEEIASPNLSALEVLIWEDEIAWAGYRHELT